MGKNKRFYWLKLKDNFFEDKTIKKLRKIAGGDTYTIIYFKMLLKSTKSDGKLYYDGIEDTFEEELALDIDEDVENVRMTILFLEKTGLLVEENGQQMEFTRFNEMVGSETDKAELMRIKRAKEKNNPLPNSNNVTQMLPDVTLRYQNVSIDRERDRDRVRDRVRDEDREKEIEKKGEYEREKEEEEKQTEKSEPQNVENSVDKSSYEEYRDALNIIEQKRKQLAIEENKIEFITDD